MPEESGLRSGAVGFDLHDEETMQNPYEAYAQMRSACPVAHSDALGGHWLATSYDAVRDIYSSFRTFSSAQGVSLPAHDHRLIPLEMDPPLQTRFRRLLNPLFTVEAVALKAEDLARVTHEVIDSFAARGEAELVTEFMRPVLGRVVLPHLGIPVERHHFLAELTETITRERDGDMPAVDRAFLALKDYLSELVRTKRGAPPSSNLIGTLIQSSVEDRPVTDDEIVRILIVTLLGGLDTTTAVLCEALYHLVRHPEDARALREGEKSWSPAIEEFVRYTAPVQGLRRVVTKDVTLKGAELRKGDAIVGLLGAANRDPDRFPDPDRCVLDRDASEHLSFGAGAHICLGRNLARLEIEIMLSILLQRLPSLALPKDFKPHYLAGEARGMSALPVIFTPSKSKGHIIA